MDIADSYKQLTLMPTLKMIALRIAAPKPRHCA